uniref:Uncharacterized protein n=1 Tax=Trieres chinensis TaxID=1514140 RepID=A0A7S1ZI48_TRICV|mmetsp:Transcript_25746/g.52717  ORF Transcript_25746/g.52717 Transcript_25746/m.52717 type:complete len:117 (+) Transcript_25746:2-352(+)
MSMMAALSAGEAGDMDGMVFAGMDDDGMAGGGRPVNEEDGDDLVCRVGGGEGPVRIDDDIYFGDDGGATEEERAAMLERLDAMLVVPREYEIASGEEDNVGQGGQFDDADEDDGLL